MLELTLGVETSGETSTAMTNHSGAHQETFSETGGFQHPQVKASIYEGPTGVSSTQHLLSSAVLQHFTQVHPPPRNTKYYCTSTPRSQIRNEPDIE